MFIAPSARLTADDMQSDTTMEDEQLSDTFSYLNPPTSPLANKSAKRRRDTEDEDDEAVNQFSAKRRRSKAPAPPSPA